MADVMASPPLSIGPERSIFEAMEILVDRGISGLPVVGTVDLLWPQALHSG